MAAAILARPDTHCFKRLCGDTGTELAHLDTFL